MSWKPSIRALLGSGTIFTMAGGVIYVSWIDHYRYSRMISIYKSGNILPPFNSDIHESAYFPREALELKLRQVLKSQFTNEYFLINGDVGTGKTRTIVKLVREMMSVEGKEGKGAPVYVQVNQGKRFSNTLAAAVGFCFDEHISFRYFLDTVLQVRSMPQSDDGTRLIRVFEAIEKSSFEYANESGRPVVIVVDGIQDLQRSAPDILEKLLKKACLWADTNTVKMVFVNSDEETQSVLERRSSSMARMATPITVRDLSSSEAVAFLTSPHFNDHSEDPVSPVMDKELALSIFDTVGGRLHHLVTFRRDWSCGMSSSDITKELKTRERMKFDQVSLSPSAWKAVSILRSQKADWMLLSKMIKSSSAEDVKALVEANVIRYDRKHIGTVVRFRSPLAANVAHEMQQSYLAEKSKQGNEKSTESRKQSSE